MVRIQDQIVKGADRPLLLSGLLRTAYRAVTSEVGVRLAGAGFADVQPSHLPVLGAIWRHPAGIRSKDIADASGLAKQTVKQLVDDLERTGYVERVADPDDGRAQRVRFTRRGRQWETVAVPILLELEHELEARLGRARMVELRGLLQAVTTELEDAPSPPGSASPPRAASRRARAR